MIMRKPPRNRRKKRNPDRIRRIIRLMSQPGPLTSDAIPEPSRHTAEKRMYIK